MEIVEWTENIHLMVFLLGNVSDNEWYSSNKSKKIKSEQVFSSNSLKEELKWIIFIYSFDYHLFNFEKTIDEE